MLPEKFKAIIKKKKKSIDTFIFSSLPEHFTCPLPFLNILLSQFYENDSSSNMLSYSFSFAIYSFLSSSLAYSFSSKNEAVEINYKA